MQWDYKNHPHFPKPKDEDGYLESMSKIVFSTGLNWTVVDKKWPGIKKAFANFSIQKVSNFDAVTVTELLEDPGIIRSESKIKAIIKNALAIQEVEKEIGSFRNYIDQTKTKGIDSLLKDLKLRFSYMGDSTSVMFLFGVGEETPQLLKMVEKSHKK